MDMYTSLAKACLASFLAGQDMTNCFSCRYGDNEHYHGHYNKSNVLFIEQLDGTLFEVHLTFNREALAHPESIRVRLSEDSWEYEKIEYLFSDEFGQGIVDVTGNADIEDWLSYNTFMPDMARWTG